MRKNGTGRDEKSEESKWAMAPDKRPKWMSPPLCGGGARQEEPPAAPESVATDVFGHHADEDRQDWTSCLSLQHR